MIAQANKPSPQEARIQRARQQFDRYSFRLEQSAAGETCVEVTKRADGTTYTVDAAGCSCDDFFHRGEPCKHCHMVSLWLSNGVLLEPAAEKAARAKRAQREADLLWG